MQSDRICYLIFILLFLLSYGIDWWYVNRKKQQLSLRQASTQYLLWILMALGYALYLWRHDGHAVRALHYLSAYCMEVSLSIDNIFVFVLIFTSLRIHAANISRVLTIGVLLAILLRMLFITAGIWLVGQFHWILYGFGLFLVYTGVRMFFHKAADAEDIRESRMYRFIRKYLRYTDVEPEGRYMLQRDGKVFFTRLFLTVLLVGMTDVLFALDSIPAVFAITTDRLVVYSSDIFAVMGLRSLFFILQKMTNQFTYLPQGIALVLVFIGVKMWLEILTIFVPVWVSLPVILLCIAGAILVSVYTNRYVNRSDS